MTPPAVAAQRFALALLLGCGLGLYYGFLRPLRPKYTVLSDLLFAPALVWAWVWVCFPICDGDIRLAYVAGLPTGILLWEATAGKALRPVFSYIWKGFALLWRISTAPVKIFFVFLGKICKKLYATGKKWVTIVQNISTMGKGGAHRA